MDRLLSVIRRRPHVVDIVTPRVSGATGYRLKWQVNFDASVTTFLTSGPAGFFDTNVNRNSIDVQMTNGVRIVFDPTTYSIPDDTPFWLRLYHLLPGETQVTASLLVLPDLAAHGYRTIIIAGQAPNGGSLAASLQIDLPRLMSDLRMLNHDAATNIFVATEPTGYEYLLKAGGTTPQMTTFEAPVGSLWVRGNGAAANFSATMTMAHPK